MRQEIASFSASSEAMPILNIISYIADVRVPTPSTIPLTHDGELLKHGPCKVVLLSIIVLEPVRELLWLLCVRIEILAPSVAFGLSVFGLSDMN